MTSAEVDARGNLVTEGGKKIPPLPIKAPMFMDRSLVIYGPSGTGKTVITKAVMKAVQGHIEQILVVSPSEPSNRAYEGFVDAPFVHHRIYMPDPNAPKKDDGNKGALRFLEAVWSRQEMLAAIYTRANNARVLGALFARLPKSAKLEGLKAIERINDSRVRVIERLRRQHAADVGRRDEKIKNANELFKKALILLYKKYLTPHYDDLCAIDDLTEDESYSLVYMNCNPRLLLIFDDCAAQLKPFFNKDIFRKLFYQNRHSFITVLVCAQDDTDVPANLRKNAFISFFTEQIVCLSNFDRSSNKFPKPTRQYVADIVPSVFRGHRKLAYIRDDENRQHFYHVLVPYPTPFRFGSPAMHELCESVASEGVAMDRDNPYYDRFALGPPGKRGR